MAKNSFIVTISLTILGMGVLTSCGKQEAAAPQASQVTTMPGDWKTALPAGFEGLAVKDGGACYLDAVNGPVPDGPARVKSGAPAAFSGWAVADVKSGGVGTAVG